MGRITYLHTLDARHSEHICRLNRKVFSQEQSTEYRLDSARICDHERAAWGFFRKSRRVVVGRAARVMRELLWL